MTSGQACLLQDNAGSDLVAKKGAAKSIDRSMTDTTVQYCQPVAPQEDAVFCEDRLPIRSRSPGEFSTSTVAICETILLDNAHLSTNGIVTSKLEDDLDFVLKQEVIEESQWLDSAQAFEDSLKAADHESFMSPQFGETGQTLSNCAINVHLPWIDERQPCITRLQDDRSVIPVFPRSVEAFVSGFERDESFLRVYLPDTLVDQQPSAAEQLTETHNDDLQAAIEALDIAVVFGGKAIDWSDDDDGEYYPPGSAAEDKPELKARHLRPEQNQTEDDDTANISPANEVCASEQLPKVEPVEPSLELVGSDNRTPFRTCYRLPAPVIKAINLEYSKLRDLKAPASVEEDNTVYEQALAKIRPRFESIPVDILDWLHEVNGEFSWIRSEGPRDGGAWNLDHHFEQMMALALSNVEWRYFCRMLKDSSCSNLNKPTLDVTQSPKEWLMNVLGGDIRFRGYRSYETAFEEGADEEDEEEEEEKEEKDEEVNAGSQQPTLKLHHINFNGDHIYERSCTPPAVSFWAICTTRYKRLCDSNYPYKTVLSVHLKSVLSAQAFKYVDPVQRLGTNADSPTDTQGHY